MQKGTETVLYILSAAGLYYAMKSNAPARDKLKGATFGAAAGSVVVPKLEQIANDQGPSGEKARRMLKMTAGTAIAGGILGYLVSRGAITYVKDRINGYSRDNGAQQP
jgi:hypothetical protein